MRTLSIDLKKVNSTANRRLLKYIDSAMGMLHSTGCKFALKIISKPKKTAKYPSMRYDGQIVQGVENIMSVIDEVIDDANSRQRRQQVSQMDDVSNYMQQEMAHGDEGYYDESDGDTVQPSSMQNRMKEMNRLRGDRGNDVSEAFVEPKGGDGGGGDAPRPVREPKARARPKKSRRQELEARQGGGARPGGKGGKRERIVEHAKGDIGGAFNAMKASGRAGQDDEMLESWFAANQESFPGSGM